VQSGAFLDPEGEVRIWDGRSGELEQVLAVGQKGEGIRQEDVQAALSAAPWVHEIGASVEGGLIASGHAGVICWWEIPSGRRLSCAQAHRGAVGAIGFSRDGRRMASGGEDGLVRVSDSPSLRPGLDLPGHAAVVRALGVYSDGRYVVSGSADRTVRVWALP
jgi:WD40 repeat protein